MKRIGLFSLVLLTGLLFSITAQAGPVVVPGTYSTMNNSFAVKFWKEKFMGGGPGQPGNILMAVGQGFVFQHGILETAVPSDIQGWDWKSTYTGGMLTLNSSGPWLKKGNLQAKNLVAANYSHIDEDGNLHFQLAMTGSFEKTNYSFEIQASFSGTPDTYEIKYDEYGNFEYQAGIDYDVVMRIYETP